MFGKTEVPPILIIKKKKGHGGHHGGAWKVAYADFVTAMMALFIVLWIVGQNKQVKDMIAAYFKDPGAFSRTTRSGSNLPGGGALLPAQANPGRNNLSNDPKKGPLDEVERFKSEGKRLEAMISSVKLFDKFKNRIEIHAARDGLRVELIEDSVGLFFDVGSAQLKAETVELLRLIGSEIGKMPNSVIIEGYTDARPFVSPNYSNWELSADRANAARRILEAHGLREDQVLEVRGIGDRKLKNPKDPHDYSNRRVTIFVVGSKSADPPLQPDPLRDDDNS